MHFHSKRNWSLPLAAASVHCRPLARRLQLRYSLAINRVIDASTTHHLVQCCLL